MMIPSVLGTLQPSIDKYFSGLSCPELLDFMEELKESENVFNVIWALMDPTNPPLMQFFSIVLLRNMICSCNSNKLESDYEDLRNNTLKKLSAIQRDPSVSNLCSAMTKKLYEVLVQLILRISRVRFGVVREVLLLLTKDLLSGCASRETLWTQGDSEICASDALTFLSILVEEYSIVDFTYHDRQRVKQAILSDEDIVFDFLRYLLTTQHDESIQVRAMQCCSLWMSTFSTSTCSTIEHTDLLDIIYQAMHRSELFFSAGLDCLITMFEEGGSELCYGRDTVYLLDNHVVKLASLHSMFEDLIRLHSEAVYAGIPWNEFEQKGLLSKAILLIATLAEKQMEHLVRRALDDSGGTNNALRTVFHMFLLPFSLVGSYPRDEAVSDLALQVWSNLLECVEDDDGNSHKTVSKSSFLRDIHLSFLKLAFVKCQYRVTLKTFLTSWSSDEREQWLKFRGDLADTIMLAYSHPVSTTWFSERCHLDSLVNAFQQNPIRGAWHELEASLFVSTAISEQLVQEFHHANPVAHELASRIVHNVFQLIQIFMTYIPSSLADVAYEEYAAPRCLLATRVLQTLEAYSSIVSCLRQDTEDSMFLRPLALFILFCFDDAMRLTCHTELWTDLATTAIRTLKALIQELTLSENQAVEMLDLVHRLMSSHSNRPHSVELLLAHCFGCLLPYAPSVPGVDQLLQMLINKFEQSLRSADRHFSPANAHNKVHNTELSSVCLTSGCLRDKFGCPPVMSVFVEFFRGFSISLNKLEEGTVNLVQSSPSSQCAQNRLRLAGEKDIHVLVRLIQLLIQSEFHQWECMSTEFLNELSRFLQSAFHSTNALRRIDSGMFCSDSLSQVFELLSCLVDQLLQRKTDLHGPLLKVVWFVVDSMASSTLSDSSHMKLQQETMLRVVSKALRHIDDSLMNATAAVLESSNAPFQLSDFGPNAYLSHPIPATLLLTCAQRITDQIESFAKFLYHTLVWQPNNEMSSHRHTRNFGLLDAVEHLLGDSSLLSWRLCMTVGFTGMCLPEWSTAEPSIRLAKTVLERINDIPASHKATLITSNILFETHSNLLLILADGALPRRLITKYAELYAALSQFLPDKQFALVCFLLGCAETPSYVLEWFQSAPYLNVLLTRVRQAVERTSVCERHRFVSTVTRGCARLKTIADAIGTFGSLCNQTRSSNT